MVRNFLIAGLLVLSLSGVSYGRNRRHPVMNTMNGVAHAVSSVVSNTETKTAQGIANIMARLGRVGHFGGNPGYEGCGMASTKEGAYNICCYANMPWKTVDVGFAQNSNGQWFCCRRYQK